ncbi:HNH endonuclease [Vibrio vulnificus]|uniref:HNH endonuclease n=1 Tax=Vibrio vulnificus TaxID=672 RepID=UPI000F4E7ABC|nr:hypothetical protein [Vibrio vulnificus]MCA3987378.1 hypothetical protein [Vibrio vulnificus]MCU8178706.1 hypothetical protein [Vibrio vulnificus]RPB36374.1 hypothetical protein CYV18_04575 [Vibrio vulnificus]
MFAISKPTIDIDTIFLACANSIKNNTKKERILKIGKYIRGSSKVYDVHANYRLFYKLIDEYDTNAACDANKDELIELYEGQLRNKEARQYYDKLLSLAINGLCPFCGFAQATTLDHYMPKKKYPSFSIYPLNLIPSCGDCNFKKREGVATLAGEQIIHPYYDSELFKEQWLFATVKNTTPASLVFTVEPPSNFSDLDKERISSHFKELNLAQRFSVQVANEIAQLRFELDWDFLQTGAKGVKRALDNKFQASNRLHKNSWKTAMYQALASSDWYCNGGFK